MLKRVLADRRPAEDGPTPPAAGPEGETSYPVPPDPGERRLGWFVAAIAILAVVALAATLSRLPGLRGSPSPLAMPGAPAARWATGDSARDTSPGPAGDTPPGSVAAPPSAGGPGDLAAAPETPGGLAAAPTTGRVATPLGQDATAAPDGTAGPATTALAGTDGPGATAEPVPAADPPPDVQAAVADLSAAIRQQVTAGQLASQAGIDLQGKVNKIGENAREGDRATARYYAAEVREKLGKYLDSGTITATGYRALIPWVDVVDDALS